MRAIPSRPRRAHAFQWNRLSPDRRRGDARVAPSPPAKRTKAKKPKNRKEGKKRRSNRRSHTVTLGREGANGRREKIAVGTGIPHSRLPSFLPSFVPPSASLRLCVNPSWVAAEGRAGSSVFSGAKSRRKLLGHRAHRETTGKPPDCLKRKRRAPMSPTKSGWGPVPLGPRSRSGWMTARKSRRNRGRRTRTAAPTNFAGAKGNPVPGTFREMNVTLQNSRQPKAKISPDSEARRISPRGEYLCT